jgi:aminomethyltransferase
MPVLPIRISPGCSARLDDWQLTVTPRRVVRVHALAMLAVQGPNARQRFWQVLPECRAACAALKPFFATSVGDYFIASTGYTGEDGYEITLPAEQAESLWRRLSRGRRAAMWPGCPRYAAPRSRHESLRPGHGRNRFTARRRPGLDSRPRLGTRLRRQGRPPREATAIPVSWPLLLDRGVLRAHQPVHTAYGAGEITSGSFSPTMQQSIALARLPLAVAIADAVQVAVRDKLLSAQVVKPCFVRNGNILV